MDDDKEHGFFGVRFVRDNKIGIRAELTGDHWTDSETSIAKAVIVADASEALMGRSSPIYLVSDHEMKFAMRFHDDPVQFTQTLLYSSSSFSDDEFYERVDGVVRGVLGSIKITVPWGEPLTEEEINEIFSTFGVERIKS